MMQDEMQVSKPDELKQHILSWLESMSVKDAPYGTYKMSASTEATLFSSCFAAFVRQLYNNLRNISPEQQCEWIDLINSEQDEETGFFIDPRLKYEGLFSEHLSKDHDWAYVTWQSTCFCISALKALGGEMKHRLRFLDEWRNPDKVTSWLENLDWRRGTWTAGNVAMFLGVCLITDYETNNDIKARDALEAFFDWHDNFQDPKTGFWGTNCGTPVHIGLFGAMHQYLLYYYTGRPLRYMERIVDNTLLIQQPDGLFSSIGGGGACEDLDAVDTLVNMYQRIDYRRNDIEKALQKVLAAIVNSQNEDGGFPWAKRHHFGIKEWLRVGLSHSNSFNYWYHSCREAILEQTILWKRPLRPLGWTRTPIPATESYIFPTWFRSLTLALITQVLPENPYARLEWKFLTAPGLGYFAKVESQGFL
jgi:hypothetical protein